MTAAVAVAVLVAGGTYLVLQRELLRVVLGFVLLGHGVNVLIIAAGGMDLRGFPLLGPDDADPDAMADPLPQAFVLTAIVITFAITVYLLGLLKAEAVAEDDGPDPAESPGSDRREPAVDRERGR